MNLEQWQSRYDNPVRMSLTPNHSGAWDQERLFVPELHASRGNDVSSAYDNQVERRHSQIRGSTGVDRDRAELMLRTEQAAMLHYTSADLAKDLPRTSVGALEARQDLMQREKSMARLVEHDRAHAHPMVLNPQREAESATLDEKRQWAERGGRRLDHEERVALGHQGAYDPFRRPGHLDQAREAVSSFMGAAPEPMSAVAAVVSDTRASSTQRRSPLVDRIEKPRDEQKSQAQDSQPSATAVRRSPLSELIKQRESARQPSRSPAHEREQEQGVSLGW